MMVLGKLLATEGFLEAHVLQLQRTMRARALACCAALEASGVGSLASWRAPASRPCTTTLTMPMLGVVPPSTRLSHSSTLPPPPVSVARPARELTTRVVCGCGGVCWGPGNRAVRVGLTTRVPPPAAAHPSDHQTANAASRTCHGPGTPLAGQSNRRSAPRGTCLSVTVSSK